MTRGIWLASVAVVALAVGACNDVGDCPAAAVAPGGSCSGDSLQCPYTIQAAGVTCNTSCVCTNGAWVCPDPSGCLPAADDGGGGGDDGGGGGGEAGDDAAGQ
jgi:hypothetical protein